ncbi:uncharacterized protein LOC119673248 isoform X4 [Teleopsis dalmanni]|uniref:uncharacterized protein LOC119673248 isoform X4 n=1 Tax=Teleopsis dalmanni TaxID=139649 RepID=UPI0018CDCA03|nr:uncharacterized protein LOC119673248 isoform X4 [Teleopsis dalmanni]
MCASCQNRPSRTQLSQQQHIARIRTKCNPEGVLHERRQINAQRPRPPPQAPIQRRRPCPQITSNRPQLPALGPPCDPCSAGVPDMGGMSSSPDFECDPCRADTPVMSRTQPECNMNFQGEPEMIQTPSTREPECDASSFGVAELFNMQCDDMNQAPSGNRRMRYCCQRPEEVGEPPRSASVGCMSPGMGLQRSASLSMSQRGSVPCGSEQSSSPMSSQSECKDSLGIFSTDYDDFDPRAHGTERDSMPCGPAQPSSPMLSPQAEIYTPSQKCANESEYQRRQQGNQLQIANMERMRQTHVQNVRRRKGRKKPCAPCQTTPSLQQANMEPARRRRGMRRGCEGRQGAETPSGRPRGMRGSRQGFAERMEAESPVSSRGSLPCGSEQTSSPMMSSDCQDSLGLFSTDYDDFAPRAYGTDNALVPYRPEQTSSPMMSSDCQDSLGLFSTDYDDFAPRAHGTDNALVPYRPEQTSSPMMSSDCQDSLGLFSTDYDDFAPRAHGTDNALVPYRPEQTSSPMMSSDCQDSPGFFSTDYDDFAPRAHGTDRDSMPCGPAQPSSPMLSPQAEIYTPSQKCGSESAYQRRQQGNQLQMANMERMRQAHVQNVRGRKGGQSSCSPEQARADSMDYSTDESDCIVYDDPDYTTDVEDVSRLNWSAELMNEKLRRKPELRKGMGPERPPQPAPCSPGAQERKDREDREYVAKCMFGVKEVENIQNLNLSSSPQRPQEEDLPWGLTSRAERVCGRKGSNKRVFNVPRRWKYRRPPSSPMCGVPLPGRGPAASTPQEFTSPPARSSGPSPCPSPCPPSPASPCPSAAAAPCPSSAQGAVGGRPLTSPQFPSSWEVSSGDFFYSNPIDSDASQSDYNLGPQASADDECEDSLDFSNIGYDDFAPGEHGTFAEEDPCHTTDVEDVSRLNWSDELMNEKLRRKPELRKGMGPERPPQPAPCSPGAQERKDREDREYVAKCMFGVKEVGNIQNLNLSSSPQRPQEEDLPWGLTSRAERVCGRKGSNKRVFNVPRRWKYRRPPSSPMCGVPLPGRGPAASTPQEFTSPPARSSGPSPCPSPCPPSPASPCPSAAAAPCPSSAQGAVGGRPLTSPQFPSSWEVSSGDFFYSNPIDSDASQSDYNLGPQASADDECEDSLDFSNIGYDDFDPGEHGTFAEEQFSSADSGGYDQPLPECPFGEFSSADSGALEGDITGFVDLSQHHHVPDRSSAFADPSIPDFNQFPDSTAESSGLSQYADSTCPSGAFGMDQFPDSPCPAQPYGMGQFSDASCPIPASFGASDCDDLPDLTEEISRASSDYGQSSYDCSDESMGYASSFGSAAGFGPTMSNPCGGAFMGQDDESMWQERPPKTAEQEDLEFEAKHFYGVQEVSDADVSKLPICLSPTPERPAYLPSDITQRAHQCQRHARTNRRLFYVPEDWNIPREDSSCDLGGPLYSPPHKAIEGPCPQRRAPPRRAPPQRRAPAARPCPPQRGQPRAPPPQRRAPAARPCPPQQRAPPPRPCPQPRPPPQRRAPPPRPCPPPRAQPRPQQRAQPCPPQRAQPRPAQRAPPCPQQRPPAQRNPLPPRIRIENVDSSMDSPQPCPRPRAPPRIPQRQRPQPRNQPCPRPALFKTASAQQPCPHAAAGGSNMNLQQQRHADRIRRAREQRAGGAQPCPPRRAQPCPQPRAQSRGQPCPPPRAPPPQRCPQTVARGSSYMNLPQQAHADRIRRAREQRACGPAQQYPPMRSAPCPPARVQSRPQCPRPRAPPPQRQCPLHGASGSSMNLAQQQHAQRIRGARENRGCAWG